MSVIGLRAGPYEVVAEAAIPGSRQWFVARRKAAIRTVPPRALLRVAGVRAMDELRAQYNVLRTIQDPRIPTAIGLYEEVGALATTLVSGKPLAGAIAGRQRDELHMTPATLLDVLMELSEALARAHGRQCHHGRLDPDFVWLTEGGSLWILGFGEPPESTGSPRWMAPERARGGSIGAWTDQWSLAALGTGLITGQALWSARDPEEQARVGDTTPSLTVVAQQWPALARVFHKMLDPEPGRRFSNMAAVRQELAYLARQAGNASDRRALGEWLARGAEPVAPPPPEFPAPDFEASTVVLERSEELLRPVLAASAWDRVGHEADSEVTAMTEVFYDGVPHLAEAAFTEPGDDPSLFDTQAVDPVHLGLDGTIPRRPMPPLDAPQPGVQQAGVLQAMVVLDDGVTEVDEAGPMPTSTMGATDHAPPPRVPSARSEVPSTPRIRRTEPARNPPPRVPSEPILPRSPERSNAATLWLFVLVSLLVAMVGGIWLLAAMVGL